MFSNLLPKSFNFFNLLEKQVGFSLEAARYFKELLARDGVDEESLQKMRDIEHSADEVAHEIIHRLNTTFITPFDREDILSLAKEVDDIVDMINTIVSRMVIYKLNGNDRSLIEFSLVIEESVRAVSLAIQGLRNTKNAAVIQEACVEINRLENVGDSMRDRVLVELFERAKDPIAVIKWKEIYQDAETVLDVCEDVAHIVDSILVKQA
ncbi:MAG: DUF47 family protein [Candidatus Omnitrophota bacterium]|jgi:predicted phosphate transport protein (TIGR00153 family)